MQIRCQRLTLYCWQRFNNIWFLIIFRYVNIKMFEILYIYSSNPCPLLLLLHRRRCHCCRQCPHRWYHHRHTSRPSYKVQLWQREAAEGGGNVSDPLTLNAPQLGLISFAQCCFWWYCFLFLKIVISLEGIRCYKTSETVLSNDVLEERCHGFNWPYCAIVCFFGVMCLLCEEDFPTVLE